MNIITYGKDERLKLATMRLSEITPPLGAFSVHLFPIPTTRDGKTLAGEGGELSSVGKEIKEGDVAFCYGGGATLSRVGGGRVYDLSRDEIFLEGNAYLTAVAALGYLFCEKGFLPKGKRVGVIGFGRIGSAFSKLIAYFGGELTVFTSKTDLKDTLFDMGISGALTMGMNGICADAVKGLDLLVNTAEAPLVGAALKEELKETVVLELASGDNIPEEIVHEVLHALPTKYFPKEAGMLYVRRVMEILTRHYTVTEDKRS